VAGPYCEAAGSGTLGARPIGTDRGITALRPASYGRRQLRSVRGGLWARRSALSGRPLRLSGFLPVVCCLFRVAVCSVCFLFFCFCFCLLRFGFFFFWLWFFFFFGFFFFFSFFFFWFSPTPHPYFPHSPFFFSPSLPVKTSFPISLNLPFQHNTLSTFTNPTDFLFFTFPCFPLPVTINFSPNH